MIPVGRDMEHHNGYPHSRCMNGSYATILTASTDWSALGVLPRDHRCMRLQLVYKQRKIVILNPYFVLRSPCLTVIRSFQDRISRLKGITADSLYPTRLPSERIESEI